ncbi:hypothetical protein LSAT2_025356 [Lamellibrachia satsuma]|nr:hypothetical protein LSAT2_025356 [Lamellibrachia satsuma]
MLADLSNDVDSCRTVLLFRKSTHVSVNNVRERRHLRGFDGCLAGIMSMQTRLRWAVLPRDRPHIAGNNTENDSGNDGRSNCDYEAAILGFRLEYSITYTHYTSMKRRGFT